MSETFELRLLFNGRFVGSVHSAYRDLRNWYGDFEPATTLASDFGLTRVREFIEFCRKWNELQDSDSPPAAAEFDRFRDIVQTGKWIATTVERRDVLCIEDAPVFFEGGFVSLLQLESSDSASYFRVEWLQNNPEYPVLLYYETDLEGWETRKVDVFADGTVGFASREEESGGTALRTDCPVPSVEEIAANPEFLPHVITPAEFESVWAIRMDRRRVEPRPPPVIDDVRRELRHGNILWPAPLILDLEARRQGLAFEWAVECVRQSLTVQNEFELLDALNELQFSPGVANSSKLFQRCEEIFRPLLPAPVCVSNLYAALGYLFEGQFSRYRGAIFGTIANQSENGLRALNGDPAALFLYANLTGRGQELPIDRFPPLGICWHVTSHVVEEVWHLEAVLTSGHPHFWISRKDQRDQVIGFARHGDEAALSLLPDSGECWHSQGNTRANPDEVVQIPISTHSGDDIFIQKRVVVPLANAILAVRQFAEGEDLPSAVAWDALSQLPGEASLQARELVLPFADDGSDDGSEARRS